MRVEQSRVLSVLAHELRSPLSVIQGYARLLQQGETHGHVTMLGAILDQTGRLADLGRQASELGQWCERLPTAERQSIAVAALAAALGSRIPPDSVVIVVPADVGALRLWTVDLIALASAMATLIESVRRDVAGAPVVIRAEAVGASIVFHVRTSAEPERAAAAGTPVAFDRGGFGLRLIMASYVFDAHSATVTAAESPDLIDIRLQRE